MLRLQLGVYGDDPTKVLDILQSKEEVKKLREELDSYEKLMKETNRSWEEKLRETEERKKEEAEKLKVCERNIINIFIICFRRELVSVLRLIIVCLIW